MNVKNLEAVIREEIDPEMYDQFKEEKTLYNRIIKGKGKRTNTRGVRIPSRVAQNASFAAVGEKGTMPTPGEEDWIEMKVFPTDLFSGWSISGRALANLNQAAAETRLADIIERAAESAKAKINDAIPGNGSGELARVKSRDSGTQVTCTMTVAEGNVFSSLKLTPGARVQFVNPATGAYRDATPSEVLTSEPGTGVVTFDAVHASVVAGDLIVFEGSYNKYPHGFEAIINNGSGLMQGQSRATYPGLRSVKVDAQQAALTVSLLNHVRKLLKFRSNRADNTTIVSAPGQKQKYEEQGHNLIRFQGAGSKMQLDFPDVAHGHNGKGWEEYTSIPYHKMYGVDFDMFHKYELERFGVWNRDGQSMRYGISSTGRRKDELEGYVGIRFDLGTPLPLAHWQIDNLDIEDQATGPEAFAA